MQRIDKDRDSASSGEPRRAVKAPHPSLLALEPMRESWRAAIALRCASFILLGAAFRFRNEPSGQDNRVICGRPCPQTPIGRPTNPALERSLGRSDYEGFSFAAFTAFGTARSARSRSRSAMCRVCVLFHFT